MTPVMNTTYAGNAVRHGLSSLRHMPKGREAELGPIERELIDSRQPQTPEQLEIVQELAFAMWQKGEHERIMILEADKLADQAGELFDQKAIDDYQKLNELWLDQPLRYTRAMAGSKLGVQHFVEHWQMFSQCLKDGFGISLPMAFNAIKSEGCSISPHVICGEGIWIMTRVVALKPKLSSIAEEWLELKDLRESSDAISRVNAMFKNIPNSQDALKELHERSESRIKHWTKLHQKLSLEYESNRQNFIDQYSVNVMSSEEFEKQVQRMHRYRVFTENRIKELNRRLANIKSEILKKERQQDERAWRNQMHEVAVAQLRRPEFEQLLEYQKPGDLKKDSPVNSIPKPPRNVVLTDQDVDKIPPDWQNHKAILEQVVPNAELFQLWTNDQLNESDHLIAYLTQLPASNKHWIEQIKACQEYELQLRSLTVRRPE